MKRMPRIAITTLLSFFFGVASLTAAENIPSEKMEIYSLQEVVCTAKRAPSMDKIAIALPDMSKISIVMATKEHMLASLKEEAFMLPKSIHRADASLAPPRRPVRIFAEMRTSGPQRMKPQRPTVIQLPM